MSTEVSWVRSDDRLCLESTRPLSLYLLKLRKFIILYFIKEVSLTIISFIKQWLYGEPMPFLWFYFIFPKSHLTFKFEVLKRLTRIWWTPWSSSERCIIGLAKNLCRFLYKMGKPKWDFWPIQYLKWCLWNNEPMSEVSTQWSGYPWLKEDLSKGSRSSWKLFERKAVSHKTSLMAQQQRWWVWSLGWEDPLEEEMATHFRILA